MSLKPEKLGSEEPFDRNQTKEEASEKQGGGGEQQIETKPNNHTPRIPINGEENFEDTGTGQIKTSSSKVLEIAQKIVWKASKGFPEGDQRDTEKPRKK